MPSPLHGTSIDQVELIVPDRHESINSAENSRTSDGTKDVYTTKTTGHSTSSPVFVAVPAER
jgi:hypothetical protein